MTSHSQREGVTHFCDTRYRVVEKQAFLHGGGGPGGVVKGIKSFEAVLKLPIADLLMKRQFVLFLDAK